MSQDQLAQCKWIVGEVHGIDEWRLLDLLSHQFAIDIRKTMGDKPSKFHACNRAKMEELAPRIRHLDFAEVRLSIAFFSLGKRYRFR